MESFKVILVGLGHMGAFHYRVLREDPRFLLVAVVDPVLKSLPDGADLPILRDLDATSELNYDIAVVAAPTELHYDLVSRLLREGRHVFVEKPAAASLQQARFLVNLARDRKLRLAVGNIERCNPVVSALQSVLQSGILGSIVHANGLRAGGYPRNVKPGNDVILDLAVHELDVFRMLLGPLRVVHCSARRSRDPAIIDCAEIAVRSEQGVTGAVHVDWVTPQRMRSIRVMGTDGVAHVDYLRQSLELVGPELKTKHRDLPAIEWQTDAQGLDRGFFPIETKETLKRQLDELFLYLSGKSHHLATDEQLVESVGLVEEASAKAKIFLADVASQKYGDHASTPSIHVPNA